MWWNYPWGTMEMTARWHRGGDFRFCITQMMGLSGVYHVTSPGVNNSWVNAEGQQTIIQI